MLNTYIFELVTSVHINDMGAGDLRQPSRRLVTVRANTVVEAYDDAKEWHCKEGEKVADVINSIYGGYGGAPIA